MKAANTENLTEVPNGADVFQMLDNFMDNRADPHTWEEKYIKRVKRLRIGCRIVNILFALLFIGVFAWYTSQIVSRYNGSRANPTSSVSFLAAANLSFPEITYCGYPGTNISFVVALQYFGSVCGNELALF